MAQESSLEDVLSRPQSAQVARPQELSGLSGLREEDTEERYAPQMQSATLLLLLPFFGDLGSLNLQTPPPPPTKKRGASYASEILGF